MLEQLDILKKLYQFEYIVLHYYLRSMERQSKFKIKEDLKEPEKTNKFIRRKTGKMFGFH